MSRNTKPVDELELSDLERSPVWEFPRAGQTDVRPSFDLPLTNLSGKLVATPVRLANGTEVWGLIGNVTPTNPRRTQHFLTLSVLKGSKWFTLSRYHDINYAENGPRSLASFLGFSVEEVFPIAYDISRYVVGDSAALAGSIPVEPKEKLTDSEIIAMAAS